MGDNLRRFEVDFSGLESCGGLCSLLWATLRPAILRTVAGLALTRAGLAALATEAGHDRAFLRLTRGRVDVCLMCATVTGFHPARLEPLVDYD